MTQEEFKSRWESDPAGGGITFDDIAACAKEWGLCSAPRTQPIYTVCYRVLLEAGVVDAENFRPKKED